MNYNISSKRSLKTFKWCSATRAATARGAAGVEKMVGSK